jgi:hypothetical protein
VCVLAEQNVPPTDRFLIALSGLSVEDAKAFIDASDPVNTPAVLLITAMQRKAAAFTRWHERMSREAQGRRGMADDAGTDRFL